MTQLPDPEEWPEKADSRFVLELAGSPAKSIVLKAERTAGSNSESLATFSVSLHGFFHPSNSPSSTLWVSHACPLSSEGRQKGLYPLFLQLVQEVIARAPSVAAATSPPKLDLRRFFDGAAASQQFAGFFDLVFLCRLFWLCACDTPAEVGYLYFQAMNARLEGCLLCGDAMRNFLISIGVDWEIYFMRSLGYLLAKRSILKELSPSISEVEKRSIAAFSYATESHGLWVVRGYAPVLSMARTTDHAVAEENPLLDTKESLLRYALAHQQLEYVLQLEYLVDSPAHSRFLRVAVRLDNLRLLVAKLGFGGGDDAASTAAPDERHFPSRMRFWVGPELGGATVSCLSLGRSTANPEREIEREQTAEGGYDGSSKFPRVKAVARSFGRLRARSWRWEQEAEGNLAVFDGVLCDPATGVEAASWRPGAATADPRGAMRRRYAGPGRAFSKGGGLVVAGDELGQWVSWRVGKEMEGETMTWRVGAKVWVTYWPNELKSSYVETRSVEWHHEVEFPLVVRV